MKYSLSCFWILLFRITWRTRYKLMNRFLVWWFIKMLLLWHWRNPTEILQKDTSYVKQWVMWRDVAVRSQSSNTHMWWVCWTAHSAQWLLFILSSIPDICHQSQGWKRRLPNTENCKKHSIILQWWLTPTLCTTMNKTFLMIVLGELRSKIYR